MATWLRRRLDSRDEIDQTGIQSPGTHLLCAEIQGRLSDKAFWCRILVQNEPMIYGYARVSMDGQSVTGRDVAEAWGQGVPRSDERSHDRPGATSPLLDQFDAGDVLMVTRLDRPARSTRDLVNTLETITAKKAGMVFRHRTGPLTRSRFIYLV
jgi:hypothetical protein